MDDETTFISITAWDGARARLKMFDCAYILSAAELARLQDEAGDTLVVIGGQSKHSTTPPEVSAALADIASLSPGITSDEGQRAYTEAEVQELLAQERERVLKALRNVVSGYGYRWDKKAINGLVSKVEIECSEAKHA